MSCIYIVHLTAHPDHFKVASHSSIYTHSDRAAMQGAGLPIALAALASTRTHGQEELGIKPPTLRLMGDPLNPLSHGRPFGGCKTCTKHVNAPSTTVW